MWTYFYLASFLVLAILFASCLVEMVSSKTNKRAMYYFCVLFVIGLAMTHFSTKENGLSSFYRTPLPYQPAMNFSIIEGVENNDSSGGNCSTMSVTDKNVFMLNDRVNKLDADYQTMQNNVTTLQDQMKDLMNKSAEEAADAVGTEPYDFTADGSGSGEGEGGN